MNDKENIWISMEEQKPPNGKLLLVCARNGFKELVYIEDNISYKPWRYDDEDTPTLSIKSIKYWMLISDPEKEITKDAFQIFGIDE